VDRKYGHRGYRDAKSRTRKNIVTIRSPPQGGPRGQNDHLDRAPAHGRYCHPRALLQLRRRPHARLRSQRPVPNAARTPRAASNAALDSARSSECTQPVPDAYRPKTAKHLHFLRFRTTIEKDTAPTDYPSQRSRPPSRKPLLRVPRRAPSFENFSRNNELARLVDPFVTLASSRESSPLGKTCFSSPPLLSFPRSQFELFEREVVSTPLTASRSSRIG